MKRIALLLIVLTGALGSPALTRSAIAKTGYNANAKHTETRLNQQPPGHQTANDAVVAPNRSTAQTCEAVRYDTTDTTHKPVVIEDKKAQYAIKPVSFNSVAMDFSPTPYKDGLVFVSARQSKIPVETEESQFLDLFYTQEAADGTFSSPQLLDKANATPYHLGPTVFFDNGKQKIVTRNSFYKPGKVKDGSAITLELAHASLSPSGKWSELTPIQFRSADYSIGHPAISADGKTLYFSSNMPGSTGGSDIFVSTFEDGIWSAPKNLGTKINTQGQELFPYIHNDSILYFSSTGHPGLGGLDIFYCNLKDPQQQIFHLSAPVNGSSDDFGISLGSKGTSGFFSSNRSGPSNDDIYYFEEIIRFVEVHLYDSVTRSYVSDARIDLSDNISQSSFAAYADLMGRTDLRISSSRSYSLIVSHKDYKPFQMQLDPAQWPMNQQPSLKVFLAPVKQNEILVSRRSSLQISDRTSVTNTISFTSGPADVDIVSQALVEEPNTTTHADSIDSEKLRVMAVETVNGLPSLMIDKDGNLYDFQVSEEGHLINSAIGMTINIPQGAKRHDYEKIITDQISAYGYRSRFLLIRSFHFDSERTLIRNDASAQLDKIIEILSRYPQVNVQLTFHADSRGSEQFNLDLSRRRSEEVINYLTKTGIKRDRIKSTFVGENQLLNDCGDLADCDELQHQLNRTTEFKFLIQNELVQQ